MFGSLRDCLRLFVLLLETFILPLKIDSCTSCISVFVRFHSRIFVSELFVSPRHSSYSFKNLQKTSVFVRDLSMLFVSVRKCSALLESIRDSSFMLGSLHTVIELFILPFENNRLLVKTFRYCSFLLGNVRSSSRIFASVFGTIRTI